MSTRLSLNLLGAVAVCGAILCSCSRSEPPAMPPRIAFQETTYDFGRAAQGTQVTNVYAFRNAGGLDLTIDNVRGSCACTVTTPSGRLFHPGDDGSIAVTLDTTHDVGRRTRTITVYSNDPAQPVTTLNLLGVVDADVAAEPPALYLGHVRRGEVPANEVRLVVTDNVRIDAPVGRSKVIDASLLTAATGARIRVVIKPDAPMGRFRDMVTIRTSSTRQPTVTVPVVGVVDVEQRE